MAASGSYYRLERMLELKEFELVANRTEGMPKQSIEHSGEITEVMKIYKPDVVDEQNTDE